MDIRISPLAETDIPGAINVIQEAFQEDPYNLWVFNDRSKVIYNKLFLHLLLSCLCFVPTSSQENGLARHYLCCEIAARTCFVMAEIHKTLLNLFATKADLLNLVRNSVSLGIRCRWGIRNALFYVAKDSKNDRVLGVAMWLPPRPIGSKETWAEWFDSWTMWCQQVGMNLWYGRGGLNVKIRRSCLWHLPVERLYLLLSE
ncbi:hypothetical protein CJF30_00005996 [Rutstroemia sp. NJR-2017a BBW]|nr:hypothetical protein CJF30_00005996 [Rutstroemia sp. NJR-2017a BBW]